MSSARSRSSKSSTSSKRSRKSKRSRGSKGRIKKHGSLESLGINNASFQDGISFKMKNSLKNIHDINMVPNSELATPKRTPDIINSQTPQIHKKNRSRKRSKNKQIL